MSKLITKETTALSTTTPDYLKDIQASSGLEDLGIESLTIPRLNLLQDSTKDVKKKLAEAGDFRNSLTKEILGKSVEVIILKANAGAILINMDEGLICKSDDGKTNKMNGGACQQCWMNSYYNGTWKDGKGPACSATFDLIVVERKSILSDVPNKMAMTFRKASYKLAKDFLSRARLTNKPIFAQAYEFGSSFKDHPKGGFQELNVTFKGWVSPEEFQAASKLYLMFKAASYNIDDSEHASQESKQSSTHIEDLNF